MRHGNLLALTGLLFAAGLPAQATAQATAGPHVVSYSVTTSSRESGARFEWSDGRALEIRLRGGDILVDGARVGGYARGGALETEWRALLAWTGSLTTDEAVAAVRGWAPAGVTGQEAQGLEAVRARFDALRAGQTVAVAPPASRPRPEIAEAVAAAEQAAAEARVHVHELRDQIRNSVRVNVGTGLQEGFPPSQPRFTTPIEAAFHGIMGLLGAFVALSAIGFGISFFGSRQLDVVASTVSASFARSFFVGLFAQPLLLPAFGATIAAFVLTVVGILLVPVAIVAFVATLIAAVLGGYLAVARVAGSAWMKRRHGDHGIEGFGVLRSVAYGLAVLLAVWLPAAVLGWVPVAGTVLTWTAAGVTWALATTGFGAAILTRGGMRTTFGHRFAPPELPPASLYERSGPEISTAEWMGHQR
ncbi:MAG: hypothetical protein OER21_03585 [Gemmatimonadota bacterium]|nr:hypothetical protein [Gemmatimonadota bacterium]